jgi:hypothetical protein
LIFIEALEVEDDIEVVKTARKLLIYQKENEGFEWHGEFISLSSDLHLNRSENKIFSKTYSLMLKIFQDIGNIGIILERLEWMRRKSNEDKYLQQNWIFFASVDIEHFFVELRSIMDYVAEIIVCTAKKRGQLPKEVAKTTSFEVLKNWVPRAPGNRARLGNEISGVIESAKWFSSVRLIRDELVHEGGFALVFMEPKEGILFQVYSGFKNLVNHEIIMYNYNVAYFDRFVAIYFSHLLIFLERFAKAIRSILEPKHIDCNARGGCSEVVVGWMDTIINMNTLPLSHTFRWQ